MIVERKPQQGRKRIFIGRVPARAQRLQRTRKRSRSKYASIKRVSQTHRHHRIDQVCRIHIRLLATCFHAAFVRRLVYFLRSHVDHPAIGKPHAY